MVWDMKVKIYLISSSDYWATGSTKKSDMVSTGWLGRYYDEKHFDYNMNPPEKPIAVQIDNTNLIFSGAQRSYAFAVAMNQDLKEWLRGVSFLDWKIFQIVRMVSTRVPREGN